MTKFNESALWAKAVDLAREGVDPVVAFRKIRADGGKDLTKTEDDFYRIFERFKTQPLFAKHMVLTLKRSDFQHNLIAAVQTIDPADDREVDDLMALIGEFEKGSLHAMLECIERVKAINPDLAASLLDNAKTLFPAPFAQMEAAQNAAAKRDAESDRQLSLQPEPEQPAAVPDLPPEV